MKKQWPITVFTDGAAKGNPGPGGWGVVIVTPEGAVAELGGGAPHTTNNQMELTAAIEALKHVQRQGGAIELYSDSTYLIRGISEWIRNWQRRGWRTADGRAVLNRAYWERLADLVAARGKANPITWHYVPSHGGTPGNERADAIAVAYAAGRRVPLYRGPLHRYPVPVFDLPDATGLPPSKPMSRSRTKKAPAYSYLSVVDGRPMRHATWLECARRVKGRSGALFRKAMSAADEALILKAWGFSPEDLPS